MPRRGWQGASSALTALLMLTVLLVACDRPREIRVLSDRTAEHLAPIFEAYTKATGISVRAVHLREGLISRMESRPTEADLVITKDADLLAIAAEKGLLQPLGSNRIKRAVPAKYRSSDGLYFSDSYRARVIFYSKDRVRPDQLSSYDDLADPRWRGKVCLRSGYHDYNLNVFAQIMVKRGEAQGRAFIEKLAKNLARRPRGNDRDQAKAISEGSCDIALMNSYYMGIMLSSSEQRPWGQATRVFFPDQGGCGSYVLLSGLALTKATTNVSAARKLLEFMVQGSTQDFTAKLTYAYPVVPGRPMPAINKRLAAAQEGVTGGAFKICEVPLEAIAARREKVIQILDELRFDQHP